MAIPEADLSVLIRISRSRIITGLVASIQNHWISSNLLLRYNCAHGWLLLRAPNSGRTKSNRCWARAEWERSIALAIRASIALWR
jgi:hypothetical protein